jgi:hypothetical protein
MEMSVVQSMEIDTRPFKSEHSGSKPDSTPTGIAACLEDGTLEHAQQVAVHESPRTTKLYDRTTEQVSLNEIERIAI